MTFKTVDEYFRNAPTASLTHLEVMRETLLKALPESEEKISYNMPAHFQKKVIVYYAGYEKHIGYYPTPSAIAVFEEQLKPYKHAKGSVQFPLSDPLPVKLIAEMARFRLKEVVG